MIILGLNAYHGDAAACVVVDGQLIAAAEEERFRRVKHWAGMPTDAIRYCLETVQVGLHEVDHIAINRNPNANLLQKAMFAFSKRPSFSAIKDRLKNASKVQDLRAVLAEAFGVEKERLTSSIHQIEHHRAHLASTFYVSPFDTAAVASVDGFGDFTSTMVGVGERAKIHVLGQVMFPHSLGLFYLAMTQFLGFPNYGDEYKVMGLASCGQPTYLSALREVVQLKSHGDFTLNLDYFLHHSEGVSMSWESGAPVIGKVFSTGWDELLGPARRGDVEALTDRHANLAASLQAMYEEAFFHILADLHKQTGQHSLCLAGGCALNSVANGQISSRSNFTHVYIPPSAGDSGGAIGAAYSVWHEICGQSRSFILNRVDWGPEFDHQEIQRQIQKYERALVNANCLVHVFPDERERCQWTAERISEGKIVGWFQGRMEWGARALGYRSILADPRRANMKDILNARIKRREEFRPFAPSILFEAVDEYFEQSLPSPFMTMTYRVKPDKRAVIPAPTHVDGTGRLQTVTQEENPLYWQLIKSFEDLTAVPILLNTSFNENEPVVCTPEQALDCFLRTKMDVLVVGAYAIEVQSRQ